MFKSLRIGKVALSLFLCLAVLSLGVIGAPAPAQAKVVDKAPLAQSVNVDDLSNSADLAQLSAGMDDTTQTWLIIGVVAVIVAAGVVVAILVF